MRRRRYAPMPSRIAGTGSYLPERVLTNDELAKRVATSDEWIATRTGIRQRHIAAPDERTSDLALNAARNALEAAALAPADVDLIIVATTTPDVVFPSTACILQAKLGARGGPAFDVQAVCSGFVYALAIADRMVAGGAARNALVVGAEIYSHILDWEDRGTCVLFGDGAGAVVIEPSDDDRIGILDFENYVDGTGGDALCMPAGGSLRPASEETLANRLHYVKQEGQTVFKFAVRNMEEVCRRILERNQIDPSKLDLLAAHQANMRIVQSTAEKLGMPLDKVLINIDKYGNTTGGTIPLVLNDAVEQGRLKRGDLVLLASVGAGFTVGAVLVRWGLKEPS